MIEVFQFYSPLPPRKYVLLSPINLVVEGRRKFFCLPRAKAQACLPLVGLFMLNPFRVRILDEIFMVPKISNLESTIS